MAGGTQYRWLARSFGTPRPTSLCRHQLKALRLLAGQSEQDMAYKTGVTKRKALMIENMDKRAPYSYVLTLWWMCRYAVEIGKIDSKRFYSVLEEKDQCQRRTDNKESLD